MDQLDAYKVKRQYRCSYHPARLYPETLKNIYLQGLGALLYIASNNDDYVKFVFEQWGLSILDKPGNYWKSDPDAIIKALRIRFIGFRLYKPHTNFFFDCFCLLNHSNVHTCQAKAIIENNYLNWASRSSYKNVMCYFYGTGVTCKGVSESVITLEQHNRTIRPETKSVVVVANTSAGKSTLINAIAGHKINQARTTICTDKINCLYNKKVEDGIVYLTPESCGLNYIIPSSGRNFVAYNIAGVHYNSLLSDLDIVIHDTPGVNTIYKKQHKTITYNAIARSDYELLIYVADATNLGTNDEITILRQIRQTCTTPIIFVINKLDKFKTKKESIAQTLTDYALQLKKLGFQKPTIIPLSSYAALLFKLSQEELDEEEIEELQSYKEKFSKDFFFLSKYIGYNNTQLLDNTGITSLERAIKNLLTI